MRSASTPRPPRSWKPPPRVRIRTDGGRPMPPLSQAPGLGHSPLMKLLLVEDDKEAAAYVRRALTEVGHTVDLATEGRDGLMLAAAEPYDVIVLDGMLPRIDGLAILRTIRASGVKTPVLLLTALGGIDDRVEGLEAGGDDYLVKPFAIAELLARVNALARRPPPQDAPTALRVADL